MVENVKVSVALCTYNGASYLEKQLQSILSQSRVPDEIVICDDRSSDDTVAIANRILASSEVFYRIEVNSEPLGVADNFLKALKLTTGDWVFTCDQDDVWKEDKVEVFLNRAKEKNGLLYFSNGLLVDGEGNLLNGTLWSAYGIEYENLNTSPLFLQIMRSPVVTGAAMMVSRELIESVDCIPKPFLHDEWLSFLASAKDRAVPIDAVTFLYRQHGKNVVGAKKRSFFERFRLWSDGFQDLKRMRRDRFLKAKAVLGFAVDTVYSSKAEEAFFFWGKMNELSSSTRLEGIKSTIALYRKGLYDRYYTGIKGLVRDLLSLTIIS